MPAVHTLTLDGEALSPARLAEFAQACENPKARLKIRIAPKAKARIERAARMVQQVLRKGKAVYGVNTGFGKFAEVSISPAQLERLQYNLIRSHACGVGEPFSRAVVMTAWIIRLNTICCGNSGVRLSSVMQIVRALEAGLLALVPSQGSVGASGDLAPSAHAVLALLGEGDCTAPSGDTFQVMPAAQALKKLGLTPLKLGPKEGLSLINGTQYTTALALLTWDDGKRLLQHANLAAALSIEGLRGSHKTLDPRILRVRQQIGAQACGEDMRGWLAGRSAIARSHANCHRVQDPYSLRCAAQVHGAVYDELQNAEHVLAREINASTDNPLLFPAQGESLSGGNFHAIYTARSCDALASALTVLANISERRIALGMSKESSELPPFLIREGGLNSGFMMAQVTAAALVSECKSLSFPAAVDSIPTSGDREDHVSMGPIAGMKARRIAQNASRVLAIELLCAAQAVELLRPLRSTPRLEKAVRTLRKRVAFLKEDRALSPDIEAVHLLIQEGVLLS